MALAPEDVDKFIAIATEENLEATPWQRSPRKSATNMVWNGVSIVNISPAVPELQRCGEA